MFQNKWVISLKNLKFSFRFARIGLPHCKLILDFKLHHANDAPSKISAEDYCVDDTVDNRQVMRVCTSDFDVCKTTKCIHKCCPDGHSFANGSFCKPTHSKGVDLNFSKFIDKNGKLTENYPIIYYVVFVLITLLRQLVFGAARRPINNFQMIS